MIIFFVILGLSQISFAETLCNPDEIVFISCVTKSKKMISVCGSKDLSKDKGHLQYRFGKPEKIELEYPKDKAGSQKSLFYSNYFRANTDYSYLRFTIGDISYGVFSRTEGKVSSGGVEIEMPKKQAQVLCEGRPDEKLADLKSIAACDPDDALTGGKCP